MIPTNHDVNDNFYPQEAEFDLHSTHCNFGGLKPTPDTACFMCPRADPKFLKKIVPDRTEELAEKVKFLMPNLKILNILGIAEPFWQDKIFQILDIFDFNSHKSHITLWTTSNASVFTPKRQEMLDKITEKTQLCFSIDAATPETFLKIRRQSLFQQVCDNIKHWCEYRNKSNHECIIHNNINIYNVHEVPKMVYLAKELGVDSLTMLPTHDSGGTFKEIQHLLVNPRNAHIFHQMQKEAEEISRKINLPIYFTRPLVLNFMTKML